MSALAVFDASLFAKGVVTVIMAFILFVGSVYVLLAAVFGRRMGYLVLATAFFGWMILLSGLWAFGFFSQGPGTVTNLGPRGTESHWQPIAGGLQIVSSQFPEVKQYPTGPWKEPSEAQAASVDPVSTAIKEFLSDEANKREDIEVFNIVPEHAGGTIEKPEDEQPFLPENFSVEDVRFATASDGETSLAAARAFYTGGGPEITVLARHDSGNVPVYSYLFFIASLIGFAVHVPLLDRAEKRRKEILTGGTAPTWRGPA